MLCGPSLSLRQFAAATLPSFSHSTVPPPPPLTHHLPGVIPLHFPPSPPPSPPRCHPIPLLPPWPPAFQCCVSGSEVGVDRRDSEEVISRMKSLSTIARIVHVFRNLSNSSCFGTPQFNAIFSSMSFNVPFASSRCIGIVIAWSKGYRDCFNRK